MCALGFFCAGPAERMAIGQTTTDGSLSMSIADRQGHLTEAELELWRSPAFRRRFTESYIAETEIEPGVTEKEREQILKVMDLMEDDKVAEAIRYLQKNTNEASSPVFHFTLGNLYFQTDRFEPASVAYKRAVDEFPKFRRAWKNLGLIHVRNGNHGEAIEALTRVLELGGSEALTYGLLGFAYSSLQNHLAAESAYRLALLMDPETMDWKKGLANSLFQQSRFAEAAALTQTLIEDEPDRAEFWLLQANAFIGMNQPTKAAVNYEMVDRLGQSTVASLNMLGDIYVNQELFDMAVRSYARALETDPNTTPDRAIRAAKVITANGALGATKELIQRIEALRGETLDPNDHKDLLKLRARIAVAEGASEEEVKVLEEIVELDPLDGEALILLGQHKARAGRTEEAELYYERAANLEKYRADALIRHAELLVKQGKYKEALPLLRQAQQIRYREDVQKYLDQVERVAKGR